MNDATQTAKDILAEVGMAKKWTEIKNMDELFFSAETLISNLAFLVGPLMDAESKYRQKVQKYVSEDMSVAGAETKAKSEEEYLYWKKLQYAYELANSQIMLIKKFAQYLKEEYNRS